MMDDSQENNISILSKLDTLASVVELIDNQPTTSSNKSICIKEEPVDDYSDQHESEDSVIQSNDDLLEINFNPKEWLINDLTSGKLRPPRQHEFLYRLLEDSRYSSYLCWLDRNEGLFKIYEPERVVTLWEKVKNRQTNGKMDFDTFSRAIRCYYKSGSMIKTHKKYTFRFRMLTNNNTS